MEKPKTRRAAKNTKEEFTETYTAALQKAEEQQKESPDKQSELTKVHEKAIVAKASALTIEDVIKGLADLNIGFGKTLGSLSEQLSVEVARLADVRKAVETEKKRLQDLHDIEAAADSLRALLDAQAVKKENFETEMEQKTTVLDAQIAEKKEEWKSEQTEWEQRVKERDTDDKKRRVREEEEYQYATAIIRKKETDKLNEELAAARKKFAEEKEIENKKYEERLAVLTAKEKELKELQSKADQFPKQLAEAVKQAEEKVRAEVTKNAEIEMRIAQRDFEAEKKISALRIASFEEAVAKQAVQIEALNKQLASANAQVQDIAVKAIEGASGLKALSAVNEIALEQAKTGGKQ